MTAEVLTDVIETERLLLEPLDISRLEDFVALTADPDTMRYWAPGGPFRRDEAERNFTVSLARVRDLGVGAQPRPRAQVASSTESAVRKVSRVSAERSFHATITSHAGVAHYRDIRSRVRR